MLMVPSAPIFFTGSHVSPGRAFLIGRTSLTSSRT